MISIPRSTIRRFRAVLRRAGLHKSASTHPPLVLVNATATTLLLSCANSRVGRMAVARFRTARPVTASTGRTITL